ncbi:MAG: Gfo/Idh/MocA family oxidoreductase [Candidatus Saccharimonadales bacterium]
MDILVIGYGKIGRIKAFIWHSLGRNIHVYDTDARKRQQAIADGFDLYKETRQYSDLIVDISTPASYHQQSLEWALNVIKPRPRAILIEKPLASHHEELDALTQLLDNSDLADYRNKIIVNESYYLSSALTHVADDIKRLSSKVLRVEAELSKNRLEDVSNGRFVDKHLGSLGIELPHMIAMIQRLGFSLNKVSIMDVSLYQNPGEPHNEGFRINLSAQGIPVTIESFLGDFRITGSEQITSNDSVIRTLAVTTEDRIYEIEFDPVQGIDRYKAKLQIRDNRNELLDTFILDDDHLTKHLKNIHSNSRDEELDSFFAIDNSLIITKHILELKRRAKNIPIPQFYEESENAHQWIGETA